jgi:radical SAM protein with 4Fe4S-binding SPASM domain
MRLSNVLALGLRRIEQEFREAVYLRTDHDVTRPHVVQAIPTERCNYKCMACDCWRTDRYPQELSLEEWQHALAGLRRFVGPFTVQFAGGEPFVYKPFLQLVEWCATQGIDWGVITNGSAFSRANVERIVNARPLNISVSVDGASAATHDRSRGIEGSFDQLARGIVALREERDRNGASFAIRIKPTVHRLNVDEMPALVIWAAEVGATSIDFSPVRPWTREVDEELWMRPEDEPRFQRVAQALVEAKRAGAAIETEEARLLSLVSHFQGEVVLPSVAPCRAGLREFHILPNGEIRTCWFYPSIGNIKESDAQALWTGPTAREQRATQMQCARFGSKECASSCLAHRTLGQDWQRLRVLLRRERRAT